MGDKATLQPCLRYCVAEEYTDYVSTSDFSLRYNALTWKVSAGEFHSP